MALVAVTAKAQELDADVALAPSLLSQFEANLSLGQPESASATVVSCGPASRRNVATV